MSDEDKLINRIQSAARDCDEKSRPYFTRFLTEQEQAQLKALHFPVGITAVFFGGKGNTEPVRQCLGLIPSFYLDDDFGGELSAGAADMFPISAVTFTYRKCDTLTHRDILGSVMALGVERDTVGDIFVSDGKAAVYATEKIAELICSAISKIGRVGVKCSIGLDFELPRQQYEELRYSVASLRLDNIVKCVTNTGRTAAVDKYIRPQLVQVNSVICDNVSRILRQGDIISVRGKGKFILSEIGDIGRKGNIHISVKKYI